MKGGKKTGRVFMPSGATVLKLEEIRKRRGVSLEQISDRTKISTRFLRAIETEEFEKLPGGVFNTSYIRQYASAIGFSEEELLGKYAAFEDSRQKADQNEQAQCEARRGWTVRWVNWFRTSPAVRQY
jgi:cytoskeletal protein RodZ